MSARESFPKLWQFFGGYFHEDWMHDASDPDGIIKLFVNDSSNDELASVRAELNKLLERGLCDTDLDELLTELGCRVYYQALGMSARNWLIHVRGRLSELAEAKHAGRVI